ncbi:restriction endonuclease subunit S [Klebsiella pneumoniae]|uniref:restriction endonuclease subunit S n=1 Tax=Klebsiella TaxID=570 RepID=UPI00031C5AA6|nr:restriction endonuclease subunit S [Klebsiella pneumoniae]HCA7142685.1 restriction endonuclease subunit S [Klebsiella michiganensis]HDS9344850.1 restriction endonuclease subunit S [Klebsiella pneumoniae subsp. pneumoniae]MBC4340513.1 restriction endonuclease subunit S [Klebsiella pneumoniae]MBK2478839.1 restriction endonuclease subunit S [Klebsiella pneumoniae]MCB3773845.1 restriction endonuclease subunit S [Klebsiella pneumoniae]
MVPKLRFKGFHSQWFNSLLGDIGTFKNGLNKDKSEFGYGVPFVNLMDVFGKLEIKDNKNLSLVNANKKEVKDYSLLNGDVLFIRSSVKPTGVGETSVVTEDLENTVFSGFLIRYRNKSLLTGYKKHCFWHHRFRTRLLSLSTTSANTNINQDSLSSLDINIPCEAEQKKIADFLSSVDAKIALLDKQYKQLYQYKKGMMQKIFSQEVRFKDEYGEEFPDWEESLLSERINVQGGFAFKSQLFSEKASTKVLRIGDISEEIDLSAFSGIFSTETPAIRYQVNKGDFVMALSGATFGKMGIIKCESAFINQRVATFRLLNGATDTLSFYYYYMSTMKFNNYINSIPTASAQPNISNKDIEQYLSYIPTKKEQTKIANFLSALDDKIAIKKVELDRLKTWKQGLLQQMFV